MLTGCAMKEQRTMESLSQPIDCRTAAADIRVLKSEKAHVASGVASGVTAIVPVGLVLGLVTFTEGTKIKVATGEYNKVLDRRIAQIKSTCNMLQSRAHLRLSRKTCQRRSKSTTASGCCPAQPCLNSEDWANPTAGSACAYAAAFVSRCVTDQGTAWRWREPRANLSLVPLPRFAGKCRDSSGSSGSGRPRAADSVTSFV